MLKKIGNTSFSLRIVIPTLILLLVNTGILFAAPKVSFSISKRSVLLGDSTILTINVQDVNNPQTPELPSISNFNVRFKGVRQESFSSFSVVINGKQVEQNRSGGGYTFDYELTPLKIGILTIPSLTLNVEGQSFSTEPINIEVLESTEKSDDIFINVSLDKNNVYLGEKILATFKWYFNKNINNYHINIPWVEGLKNFLVTDPEIDKNLNYQRLVVNDNQQVLALKTNEVYKGQSYVVISFQKIITPIATGKYTLEPVFLKCDVVKGYQRANRDSFFDSAFDDFFNMGRKAVTEPFAARSTPINVVVNHVPGESMPSTFNGAVGEFSFNVIVAPTSLKAGEPITLTMKVSGSGNIEQLQLPSVPEIEVFKSYEPESKTDVSQKGGQIIGSKTFEKVLIPKRHGDYTIPKIDFTFFDPQKKKFQTITKGPFKIHVEKGEDTDTIKLITIDGHDTPQAERPKRKLTIVNKDIRYIKTDLGESDNSGDYIFEMPLAWIMGYGFPISLYLGLLLWKKRKNRFSQDVAYARNYGALRKVTKLFKETENQLSKNDARIFYSALSKNLNHYIADKLNRPFAAINPATVAELNEKGLTDEKAAVLGELYKTFDMAMFSSFNFDQDKMKKDLDETKNIVLELEKVLK